MQYSATAQASRPVIRGVSQGASVRLHRYLTEKASEPFEYGINDCATLAADWVVEHGHSDPMRRWRGKYDSEQAARDLICAHGGLAMLWMLGTMDAELPEPDILRVGDVGIVQMATEQGQEEVGAIYGGKRWVMLSEKGLFCASVKPIMAWRV